jgi:DNA polymerase III epsilon subunit family exonuclease
MIVLDNETTGLLVPSVAPLEQQPHITEIYALKLDDKFKPVGEFESFVKPPVPIPKEVIKITGITDDMVAGAPTFKKLFPELAEFFLGERILVAHNLSFDLGCLYCEMMRIDKVASFPWPPVHHCTVEMSMHLKGRRLHLFELYKMATGNEMKEAHRAKADVLALAECYKWLRKWYDE